MRKVVLCAVLLSALSWSAAIPGQSMVVTNNPVAPGGFASVTLSAGNAGLVLTSNPLHVMKKQGELVYPLDQASDTLVIVNPGASVPLSLAVPVLGAGSGSGSYVVYFFTGFGAQSIARLDVVAPTAGFPDIHSFPTKVHNFFRAHEATFAAGGMGAGDWSFGNLGNQVHTFSAGDLLQIQSAASGAIVATLPLVGISVPARGVSRVDLPLAGLAPGPYSVLTTWSDPGNGLIEQRRHGIRNASRVDLHLPNGKSLPVPTGVGAFVACIDFPFGATPGAPPLYAVAVGFAPGVTQLGPGVSLPLVPDAFSIPSVLNGLGGVLGNNVGQTLPFFWMVLAYGGAGTASGIMLNHPGVAGLTGLTLRVAAMAFDPVSGAVGASQPEFITLQ